MSEKQSMSGWQGQRAAGANIDGLRGSGFRSVALVGFLGFSLRKA